MDERTERVDFPGGMTAAGWGIAPKPVQPVERKRELTSQQQRELDDETQRVLRRLQRDVESQQDIEPEQQGQRVTEADRAGEHDQRVAAKVADIRVLRDARALVESETVETVPPTYADLGAVLDGQLDAPVPTLLRRTDGAGLVYAGRDVVLFGDPESGKSLIATHAVAEVLRDGGNAAWCDLDHAGAASTAARLIAFGAPPAVLRDQSRFRLAVIDSAPEALAVVADLVSWAPTMAVIDSLGELVPMFPEASSNSADDFRRVHRQTVKPLSGAGVATIVIDHPPKGAEAGSYGSAGSYAKRAVIDGAMYRVSVFEPFAPGRGGAARITVLKDRHGGVRAQCPAPNGRGEQVAALFRVQPDSTSALWAPSRETAAAATGDVEQVRALPPEERTVRRVKELLRCGEPRAKRALLEAGQVGVPVPP